MDYIHDPQAIERRSMEIIAGLLPDFPFAEPEAAVVKRMIHASGDPDYANIVKLHPDAVRTGVALLQRGCAVVTDVEMVRAGINKLKLGSLGGKVYCRISDPAVREFARQHQITRAMAAMQLSQKEIDYGIVAIGNAPTALFQLVDLVQKRQVKPGLIIGVPVGFVGARESKELLLNLDIPFITVLGNKGGSPIAAAAVNALLKLVE